MRIPFNCDEFAFVVSSAKPSLIFKQNFERQSRPGFILLGSFIGYTIYYGTYPLHSIIQVQLKNRFSGQFSEEQLKKSTLYGIFFLGFIFINLIVLLLAIILFEKIIIKLNGPWKNSRCIFYGLALMLISNHITKTFFWVAHSQMFTILTPLLSIYIGIIIFENNYSLKRILLLSFISGMLLLIYGNFLLLLPVILISFLLKKKEDHKIDLRSIVICLIISCLFFIPNLLWVCYLKSIGITYYNSEFSFYRQFIWIIDTLKISVPNFLYVLYTKTYDFIKTLASLSTALLLLILTIHKSAVKNIYTSRSTKIFFIKFVLLECIIFFWLLGYYADRLTFIFVPILLLIIALNINNKKINILFKYFLMAIFVISHLLTFFFNAPHFTERLFYK